MSHKNITPKDLRECREGRFDLILIDDIDLIIEEDLVKNELDDTLKSLSNTVEIVCMSSKHYDSIENINPSLKSNLACGMTLEV